MWAFSAIRKAEGLSLAATNRWHIRQYDSIRGDIPRTGRCSNRGAGDFEDMGFWKGAADCNPRQERAAKEIYLCVSIQPIENL